MTIRSSLGRFGIVTAAAMKAINEVSEGSSTLAVYVALTTRADRDEVQSWRCSVKALAEEAGVSERSVRTAKKTLTDLGLLEVTANWTPDGDRGWDSYLIRYSPPAATIAVGEAVDAEGTDDDAGFSSDQGTDQVTDDIAPSQAMDASADAAFELFWGTYRRTGPKKKAKECWLRAIKRDAPESIQAGLEAWVAYWDTPGSAQIKWPQGWLNEDRWQDTPPAVATGNSRAARNRAVFNRVAAQEAEQRTSLINPRKELS